MIDSNTNPASPDAGPVSSIYEGRDRRGGLAARARMLVVAVMAAAGIFTFVLDAIRPAEADGQIVLLPCAVDLVDCPGPSLRDALDSTVGPAAEQISGAVNELVDGFWSKLAADMAAAAVWSLDTVWSVVATVTSMPLEAVEFPRRQMIPIGIALTVAATAVAIGQKAFEDDRHGLTSVVVRATVAALGVALTYDLMTMALAIGDGALEQLVEGANDQIGIWVENITPGLVVAGPVMWPIVTLFSLLFIMSTMAVAGSLIMLQIAALVLYAVSPVFWASIVHPFTRGWARAAVQGLIAIVFSKIVIGVGIAVTASVLTYSSQAPDGEGALVSFLFGSACLLFTAFTPRTVWAMARFPTDGSSDGGSTLTSAGFAAWAAGRKAVTAAAAGTGVGAVAGAAAAATAAKSSAPPAPGGGARPHGPGTAPQAPQISGGLKALVAGSRTKDGGK